MFSRITTLIALATVIGGLTAYGQDSLQQPQVHTANGLRYVSGGFGQTERDTLQQMARSYPLKLVFSAQQGEYIADVTVQLQDAQKNVVLEAVTEGPWFYVDLPSGHYTVTTTAYAQPKQQTVQVGEGKQTELQFSWHEAPAAPGVGNSGAAPRQQ